MEAVKTTGRHLALRGRILSFKADPAREGRTALSYHSDGMVIIRDGIIRAVGPAAELSSLLDADTPVRNHHPHLILPGFIDPHLHLPQTQVIASYGTELLEWLQTYTFPEESRYGNPRIASDASRWLLDSSTRTVTMTAACSTT